MDIAHCTQEVRLWSHSRRRTVLRLTETSISLRLVVGFCLVQVFGDASFPHERGSRSVCRPASRTGPVDEDDWLADNQQKRSLHRRQGPGSHAALEDQQADRLQEFHLTEFLCKKWVKWHSTGEVQLEAKSKSDVPTQMSSLQRNLI